MVLPLLLWKKTVVIVTAALLYPLLSPQLFQRTASCLGTENSPHGKMLHSPEGNVCNHRRSAIRAAGIHPSA